MPSDHQPLSHQIDRDDGGVRILLKGELDASTASDLIVTLQGALGESPTELVVDLSELEFIDSTGLSLLVTTHKRAESDGTKFLLSRPSPATLKLLQITALTDFFNFEEIVA